MTNASQGTKAFRIAHFSDIHIAAARPVWRPGDFLSKRATGWLNLHLSHRGKLFQQATIIVEVLRKELDARRPDHIVFSGDASALGFACEITEAAALLAAGRGDGIPALAVPGNHDYYTRIDPPSGIFEREFAPWQTGRRVDDAVYPFAQPAGTGWLIGVNSARANRLPWDASGQVGEEQLNRLARLLQELPAGPRILVTHYPVCRASGEPEAPHHGLRDLADLLAVAEIGGVCLWLHGHRHNPYHLGPTHVAPFPVICTGSVTQAGVQSYHEYTFIGSQVYATRRVYEHDGGCFRDHSSFFVEMPE